MDNSIKINDNLISKINELKNEKEKLKIIFDAMSKSINDLPNCFDGKVGSEAYRRLNVYRKRFDKIIEDIDKKIMFLSRVLDGYANADSTISKSIEKYL